MFKINHFFYLYFSRLLPVCCESAMHSVVAVIVVVAVVVVVSLLTKSKSIKKFKNTIVLLPVVLSEGKNIIILTVN